MTNKSLVKIFLRKNNQLHKFMWSDVLKSDGTIIMGPSGGPFISSVENIFVGDLEPKLNEDYESEETITSTKISFHPTGKYKLMSKVKRKGSVDRATIIGPTFNEIKTPTRMAEVLIPAELQVTEKNPKTNHDAIIDINDFPNKPLRCSILCSPKNKIKEITNRQIIDTSICERTIFYEHNDLVWSWTVRISRNDTIFHYQKYYFFILGRFKWPSAEI